jgi:predicted metalloprotease
VLGGGIGTVVLVLAALYFGIDPSMLLQGLQTTGVSTQSSGAPATSEDLANDPIVDMLAVVMADTEDVWSQVFATKGARYQEPTLVVFEGTTRSACGLGQAAMGPFYCPADKNAYLDLSFFRDLRDRYRAPGDFAQAYVLAHEVGHHVQNLLGVSGEVQKMRRGVSAAEGNRLSVMLELQADCLAGAWAKRADLSGQNIRLDPGDIDEALTAAAAIGDDRLQRQSRGTVTPDSFTHGTSEQRQRWFRTGYASGDPDLCDTFSARSL